MKRGWFGDLRQAKHVLGVILFSVVAGFSTIVGAFRDIPDNNLSYPCLVLWDGGSASGFYVNTKDATYFVTAKHVLFKEPAESRADLNEIPQGTLKFPGDWHQRISYDREKRELVLQGAMSQADRDELLGFSKDQAWRNAIEGLFVKARYTLNINTVTLLSYPEDVNESGMDILEVRLDELERGGLIKMHASQDVAVLRLGSKMQTRKESGFPIKLSSGITAKEATRSGFVGADVANLKRFDDVLVGNEVFIFGYPRSLGLQEHPQLDPDRPLLRKGIVAGKNVKAHSIVIDCPVYPGNSGGLVLEREEIGLGMTSFKGIGVLSEFVPFEQRWFNFGFALQNREWQNSGYAVVVPMDAVMELLDSD